MLPPFKLALCDTRCFFMYPTYVANGPGSRYHKPKTTTTRENHVIRETLAESEFSPDDATRILSERIKRLVFLENTGCSIEARSKVENDISGHQSPTVDNVAVALWPGLASPVHFDVVIII